MTTNINYLNPATVEEKDLAFETLRDMFQYRPWNRVQRGIGERVKETLLEAARVIVNHVPAGPDRSAALRKLREARMDANSAITHNGKY